MQQGVFSVTKNKARGRFLMNNIPQRSGENLLLPSFWHFIASMRVMGVLLSGCMLSGPLFARSWDAASVAEQVLKNNYRSREVSLSVKVARIQLLRAEQVFDWQLQAEAYREDSRFEPFNGLPFNRGQNVLSQSLNLQKLFATGTTLALSVLHTSTEFDLTTGSVLPPTVNVWTSNISLTQSLWRNYFGQGSRNELKAQENLFEVAKLQRLEDLENVVLDGLRRFWALVVAQASLDEALRTKERYEQLLKNVRRKQSLGFTNPGELAQVEAELESRNQGIYRAEVSLKEAKEGFRTYMALGPDEPLELAYLKDFEKVKAFSREDFSLEEIRPVKIANLRLKASELSRQAAAANRGPELALVGQYGLAGVDKSTQIAQEEWLRGERPKAYLGVRMQWEWGSGWREGDYESKSAAFEQEQWRHKRLLLEIQDQKRLLEKRLDVQYALIQSLLQQRQFRQKAMRELNQSYQLGRVEIRTLIDSMNLAYATEIDLLRAFGDYQIAIAEWLAMKDELIVNETAVAN
jgi:outer membrane protein TolC